MTGIIRRDIHRDIYRDICRDIYKDICMRCQNNAPAASEDGERSAAIC